MKNQLPQAIQFLNQLHDEDSPAPSPENKGRYAAYSLYDKLVDYVHYVETLLHFRNGGLEPEASIPADAKAIRAMSQKRKGRTSLFYVTDDWALKLVQPQMYTRAIDLQNALDFLWDVEDKNTLKLLIDTAATMRENVAPQGFIRRKADGSPLAHGTIQIKEIGKKKRQYMYYRYKVSGGGRDNQQFRIKSHYIGLNGFISTFEKMPPNSPERRYVEQKIIEHYHLIEKLDPQQKRQKTQAFEQELLEEYGTREDE